MSFHVEAIIYKIENQKNGKCYVGQTVSGKRTRGKYYSRTIANRFVEHINSSKKTSPLYKAIKEYGQDTFLISELERCDIEDADKKEHECIMSLNTLVPQGYNVQKYSRYRNRDNIPLSNIKSVELRGIKKKGQLDCVRMIAISETGERSRLMFYGKDFSSALDRAYNAALKEIESDSIMMHSSLYDERQEKWWPYKEKIDTLDGKTIERIKYRLFNHRLVRIYVRTPEMKNHREEITFTFGGKKIDTCVALEIADNVLKEIKHRHETDPLIIDEDNRLAPLRSQKGNRLPVGQDTRKDKRSTCPE